MYVPYYSRSTRLFFRVLACAGLLNSFATQFSVLADTLSEGSKVNFGTPEKEDVREGETVTVTATGVGADPVSSQKQALSAAVQQALGGFLDQESLIRNEQVIHDKILTVSNGFIQRYEELASPRKRISDGLFETTIRAVVKKNAIASKLLSEKIVTVNMEGASAWAEQSSRIQNREDAMALFQKLYSELHRNLFHAKLIGTEANSFRTQEDPKTGELYVILEVEISVDKKWWADRAMPTLIAILEASKLRDARPFDSAEMRLAPPLMVHRPARKYGSQGEITYSGKVLHREGGPQGSYWRAGHPPNEFHVILAGTPNDLHSESVTDYIIPERISDKIKEIISGKIRSERDLFTVRFEDENGVLKEFKVPLEDELVTGPPHGRKPLINSGPTLLWEFLPFYNYVHQLVDQVRMKIPLKVDPNVLKQTKRLSLQSAWIGIDSESSLAQ